ncbi:MAG: response regulator [Paracoccaceae bacterium]
MSIPVIVVDNAETDRYIARRRFSRSDGFGEVVECQNGAEFLNTIHEKHNAIGDEARNIVVLVDINMPGKNGFETIDEYMKKWKLQHADRKVVFVMYTSSNAVSDRERAASMIGVSGYVLKPLRNQDVSHIRALAS